MILSSEDLSNIPITDIKTRKIIKEGFKEAEVDVLVAVREPIDFMFSLYCHSLRSGGTILKFSDYITKDIKPKSAQFGRRLHPWDAVFGKNLKSCNTNTQSVMDMELQTISFGLWA